MSSEKMAKLAIKDTPLPHLPDEMLLNIFTKHQLPSAAAIGQARYESLNIPKGPLIRSPIKNYVDNELGTGACTHEHEEWKLRLQTLSAISKASRRFRKVSTPVLYRVYPGQTLVSPDLFLAACQSHEGVAEHVKDVVIDPWNKLKPGKASKGLKAAVEKLGASHALIDLLQKQAGEWSDEEYALLLILRCTNVETLDTTCPSAWGKDSAMGVLFEKLRFFGPETPTTSSVDSDTQIELALRQLKHLHLHHAENMYIRSIDGFEPLMRLKSIDTLTAYRFWDGASALKALCHLRELTLWRCSFEPRELLEGLAACTELQSLTIIFAGFKPIVDKLAPEDDHIDYKSLGQLIRTKFKKLRSLRIDDRESQNMQPLMLGSLKSMTTLEHLAINEAALGCYDCRDRPAVPGGKAVTALARFRLVDMLPPSLRTLTVLRCDRWWHEAFNRRSDLAQTNPKTGFTYDADIVAAKIFDLVSRDYKELPQLASIHIDTPPPFSRDVGIHGWSAERVLGDPKLFKPSLVMNSMFSPKEKKEWKATQEKWAKQVSVVLRRVD